MLRALMLRKKIDDKKKALEDLRAKAEGFKKREEELEASITEASTDEEKSVVEAEIENFEAEKTENDSETKKLEGEISEMEAELKDIEKNQEPEAPNEKPAERKVIRDMTVRTSFHGMTMEQRAAFFQREDVKEFVERARELGNQKRTVTGAELNIPEVVLELIHEDIEKYSKLISFVNFKSLKGTARQNVLGKTPEGIWTEMGGKINEVTLGFTGIEVDGYKVAAYVPISNYLLEDSDIALGTEIINALANGLGLAIDKAILYGKVDGKMPTGILPALAAKTETLAKTNIVSIATSKTDLALFKDIIEKTSVIKHASGERFWTMNATTHTKLLAASLGVNSNAAIVSGMSDTMPVIGGKIIELDFIPDNVIIGGYGMRYLLVERAGIKVESSSDYQFIEDNTIYKATARYDGKPVFEDAFIAIGINGVTPSATAVTFAEDKANKVQADESAS